LERLGKAYPVLVQGLSVLGEAYPVRVYLDTWYLERPIRYLCRATGYLERPTRF
jgi:hypothetical protein